MRFLYSFAIYSYWFAIFLVSPFDKKAALWIKGRKNWKQKLKILCSKKKNIACFHCASFGEFEQAKPVIEKFKSKFPQATILVSFYSPSGFEYKKNDPIADIVIYLPIDSTKNAKQFIEIVKPTVFFFIKYEFWYNFMHQLKKNNVPFYYISAIFRPSQPFFQIWGKWFINNLQQASCFFVQDKKSSELLQSIGIENVEIIGDTRFDRVLTIANQNQQFEFVNKFKKDKKLIVAGSTWIPDEMVLKSFLTHFSNEYQLIIAPHLIDKEHINKILVLFKNFDTLCYTSMDFQTIEHVQVLILDSMGMLNKIYQYGEIAYIGGAFKTGLHNTIEAAVYGIPIFFGPHYHKFNEAEALVTSGGAFSIHSAHTMIEKVEMFENNPLFYQESCCLCKQYVQANLGAANKLLAYDIQFKQYEVE
ncbi:MAG: 3-deoxy-D-manno-octulosonic acid transferase [Bacteroidales bacterium]|jgi:3-deoxy-D-manno-octulosonic-acid transferase|nr:3-deoxy-D-manno-octulosonic acid transferase [Bacteroidales bacterium]